MALHNEILAGRFNRALQKLLSIKGSPPSPQIASEIMPMIDIPTDVADRYLFGWQRFWAGNQVTASVGNNSAVRLRNRSTNLAGPVIAVLEKIIISEPQADALINLQIDLQTADLAGFSAASQPIDQRLGTNTTAVCSYSGQNTFGALTRFKEAVQANEGKNLILTHDQELTLLPGTAITITTGGNNTNFTVSFLWRERSLEDSEVT